jgi:hypothetical protein
MAVERVEHQIQHELLQLHAIAEDGGHVGFQGDGDGNAPPGGIGLEQTEHVVDDVADIERESRGGSPLEQRSNAPHDLAGVLAILDDPVCGFERPVEVGRRR